MFDQKAILLAALLKVQEEVLVPGEGICYNVEIATFNTEGADDLAMNQMMSEIWVKWPEYSGYRTYPVPNGIIDPMVTFHGVDNLWEEEYGESRKRLLSFLIAELQKDSE
ncbi:hypothetical protein D3C81_1758090 [compost metagenome]